MQISTCDLWAEHLRIVCRDNATVFKSSRLAYSVAAVNIVNFLSLTFDLRLRKHQDY